VLVLVTGGAGFIGSHVAEALLAVGHGVRVLDALLPEVHAARPALPAGVELVTADVRDAGAVATALSGVDAVCHQAAMVGLGVDLDDLPAYAGANDLGTAVLLAETARAGIRRLVLASSMVVYGEGRYECVDHGAVAPGPRRPPDLDAGRFEPPCPVCGRPLAPGLVDEDARLDPRNVYAATKVAQEHLAGSWARGCGGTVAALRYHNVYGARMPRDTPYAGVASLFRSALARGEAPRVFEDGGQRRDFVDVRDVAAANVAALAATAGGAVPSGTLRAYNVGSGVPHTVGEMAAALAAALGGPAPVVTGDYRLGDVRHVTASSRRARVELGWSAEVDFATGMAAFAAAPLRAGVSTPNQRPRSTQAPADRSPAAAARPGSVSAPT
jgi:dTDP-L-rhamnose 4-epimerase